MSRLPLSLLTLLRFLALALLAALPLAAQNARNAPSECPYCKGDPALMKAAGLVSHGGFEFGTTNTAGVDTLLATCDIRWIETPHFEIGMALAPYKVPVEERKKIEAELEELHAVLPAVNPKTRVLDPWLRVHLYAMRVEKMWKRFLEIMQVKESDFPDGKSRWIPGHPYMGEGPYAGEKGKYELLVVPTVATQLEFLSDQFGLHIPNTQRWNVVDRDSMIVVMHAEDSELRDDSALHGHVAFNLTSNMLDGYKHYSYDTPLWIREGLSHFVERELDPAYNSFDSSEGGVAQMTRKSDWVPAVKKMIQAGDAPRMAELMNLRSFAEFDLNDHFATWSLTCFLIQQNPAGYACLNAKLHGIKNREGFPDGSNMDEHHRDAVKECLGWSYAELDQAWRDWALAQ